MNRRPDAWIKSSYSGSSGSCVELLPTAPAVAVRDSKNPTGPTLLFAAPTWRRFLATTKHTPWPR
jgi:hypothetical protein